MQDKNIEIKLYKPDFKPHLHPDYYNIKLKDKYELLNIL